MEPTSHATDIRLIMKSIETLKETTQLQLDHITERMKEMNVLLGEVSKETASHRVRIDQLKETSNKIELSLLALSKIEQIERQIQDLEESLEKTNAKVDSQIMTGVTKDIFIEAITRINNKINDVIKNTDFKQNRDDEGDWKSNAIHAVSKYIPVILIALVVLVIIVAVLVLSIPVSDIKEIISMFSVPSPNS